MILGWHEEDSAHTHDGVPGDSAPGEVVSVGVVRDLTRLAGSELSARDESSEIGGPV